MNKIAILYGSSGGNTESIAGRLKQMLNGEADIYNVEDVSVETVQPYKYLILGASTTGMGDLQDDWEGFLPTFSSSIILKLIC